ncbi:uncharacterized protein BDZ99DRAFT_478683 [Mytilinidion resinicola]|uniref:Uncharacterized protein n=1 Tax=Mytilinidion resinicola TaxID=574789 RepID=A0A6A6YEC0_9PEZI|nr:uncharacterized protein BDZ99DRAFT_478683 [Mytilinidion resinicola]KAF2807162.1 hypothetical protein BDZ99DRAFT_478683 [Mytilinidion resinicola]
MAGTRPVPAYCEDANSDDSDTQTDTRNRHSSGGHANVAAKRSHPSDLNNVKPVEVVGPDAASDSGYSSHTAATMSSADSAQSHQSSPPTSAGTGPAPSPSRRRPTLDNTRERSSQSSPRKPLVRVGSSARRAEREEECTVPNCECKQSQSQRRRRPQLSSLDSAVDVRYPSSYDQRSQRSDYPPPSPQASRQPPPYAQGSAIIQPASSVRRRTSSTSRPRPVSYHSGAPSEAGGYWVPGMLYPDRGPPPSMSAHFTGPSPMQPFPTIGQTPPGNYYPPGHPMYSAPYDPSRPPLIQRNSSQYSTRRPTSQYGAPVISYEQQPYREPSVSTRPPPSARYDSRQSPTFESSSSEESESEEETDRRRMPPPQRRPSIRQSNPNSYDRMSQSQQLPPRPRERERERERDYESRPPRPTSRPPRPASTVPPRTSSLRRPSLVQRDVPKSVSYSNSAGNAKVVVEAAKSRRRQSYMGHELACELESKSRNNHPLYRGETVVNSSQPRRRQTDADGRRRDENFVDTKKRDAEAYQQRMRGEPVLPLTEQLLKASKKSSRVPSGGSEAGSTRSKNSHDRASRVSQSGHSVVTNSGNGEIKLRVDGGTSFNLQLSGGERTIRVEEAEDGMRELTIATPRGNEVNYNKSERGSIAGSRRPLIMSRRDAEEDSIRSTRSSRSGRAETERRPLRRERYED